MAAQSADLQREARRCALQPAPLLLSFWAPKGENKFIAQWSVKETTAFFFNLKVSIN